MTLALDSKKSPRSLRAPYLWAPVGTGEQAYHEQVLSVTLALATIKGMVGRPHDGAIQACEGLDQSPSSSPHVMQQHPQVGGSSGLPMTTQSGRSGSAIRDEGGQTAM